MKCVLVISIIQMNETVNQILGLILQPKICFSDQQTINKAAQRQPYSIQVCSLSSHAIAEPSPCPKPEFNMHRSLFLSRNGQPGQEKLSHGLITCFASSGASRLLIHSRFVMEIPPVVFLVPILFSRASGFPQASVSSYTACV